MREKEGARRPSKSMRAETNESIAHRERSGWLVIAALLVAFELCVAVCEVAL